MRSSGVLQHAAVKSSEALQVFHKFNHLINVIQRPLHNCRAVHVAKLGVGKYRALIHALVEIWRPQKRNRERDKGRNSNLRRAGYELQLAAQVSNAAVVTSSIRP